MVSLGLLETKYLVISKILTLGLLDSRQVVAILSLAVL